MQSATQIKFVGHTARNVANAGGQSSVLTINFRVASKGPAHVAGVISTANFWAATTETRAAFQSFDGTDEVWKAVVTVPGNNVSFEYVIFCDDFRGVNAVPRIWNTNGGDTFKITSQF